MLMLAIFLGFNLIMNGTNGGNKSSDWRKPAEIFSDLQKANAAIKDVTITKERTLYLQRFNEEATRQNLSKDKILEEELKTAVLMADTKLKAAIQRKSTQRSNEAFMLLEPLSRKYQSDPLWKKQFPVAAHPDFDWNALSPAEAFTKVSTDLDTRYKSDLVFGFVPGYQFIDSLVALTGRVPGFSYAFAALLLAIVVRAIVYPFAQRQLNFSRQMSALQPKLRELQEAYSKSDATGQFKFSPEYQAKVQGLYKEYGLNPAAGCVPMFIQLPFFILVYNCMLHYRFAFQNGTFLWINKASSEASNGLFASSLGQQDLILLIIYGASMLVSMWFAPVSDPQSAKQSKMMGIFVSIMVTVMMFFFPLPSAFVLYWLFLNILATIQSLRAYRQPLPELVRVNAPNGAVYPMDPNGTSGLFGAKGTPRQHKPKAKR